MKTLAGFFLAVIAVSLLAQTTSFPPGAGGGGGGGASGTLSVASASYTTTSYLPPGGGGAASATETNVQGLVTISGTINNFSANLSATPGIGNTLTFTWRKNGSDQAVTCSIANPATSCVDNAHNFQVAANDLIDIKVVATGTPAATTVTLFWSTPGAQGPVGSAGAGYAATSTSSLTIGTGSTTFTTQAGLAYSTGARARASNSVTPTNYMEGLVTSYSGTSLVINVDTVGGSGTFNSWNINAAGNVGQTGAAGTNGSNGSNGSNGATGPGYTATSTTSITVGTGSQSFTTQAGLAYTAGARARASSTGSSAYVEGLVTSYSGTSLVINVDTTNGSGAHTDWNINVAGNVGQAGSTGATGPAGPAGPQVTAVNAQTGTSYTFLNSDCTKLVTLSNSSAVSATLPQAGASGQFLATCGIWVNNLGTGTVTITPTTSTINGATTLKLLTKQSALVISDGTNYSAQAGSGSPSVGSSGTLQCSDGNGGYVACVSGTQYDPATSGSTGVLAPDGTGKNRAGTWADIQTLLTGCSNGQGILYQGTCVTAGGQAAADIPVTQSAATATFTCSSNTVNTFRITLTQNVTSSTLASCGAGQILNFVVGAGTGPFTFSYPTGFSLAAGISPIANAITKQVFEWNGASAIPLGPATSDSGPSILITAAMPAGNPASGFAFCVYDSTQLDYQCKDSSGNITAMIRIENCVSNNWVNGIAATGRIGCSQPASTQMSDTANILYTNQNRSMGSAALTFPGGDIFLGGVNAQSGTSYTVGAADEDKLTTFNNGSAVAVTLPQATTAGFVSGAFFYFFNRGAGTVTITPTVSTINGSATLTLSQNQGCLVASDGTNYSAWVSASPAGGNATTVNGGSIPASAPFVGTNSSNQIVLATPFATNAQTATYQVVVGDFTSYKTIIVASGTFNITLVANTSQPATGQLINIINYGSGVVTVVRSGQNINGGTTSLTLPAGSPTAPSSATVVSDGTNYFAMVMPQFTVANMLGLGTGVGTFLATPSGTNLASALTTGLPQSKFGTGIDSSASTGVLSYASGTPSVGAVPTGQESTNTVTAASNAGAAKQLWLSGGANKTATAVTFPHPKYAAAADCVNAVAGSAWSTGATPAALCRAGTNNKQALLSPWGASDTGTIQFHIDADADLTTTLPYLMLELTSTDATNGHTIIMQESVACAKEDGSTTDDVAFNAARSLSTITLNGNANRVWQANIQLNSTDLTGCAAPGLMWVKISRTTDTATNVGVYGLTLTEMRLLTVQAN